MVSVTSSFYLFILFILIFYHVGRALLNVGDLLPGSHCLAETTDTLMKDYANHHLITFLKTVMKEMWDLL